MTPVDSYFKYLTCSETDVGWGLYLNTIGKAVVYPNENYPKPGHPSGYNFSWVNGRVLQEFQINYITAGEGIIETDQGSFRIQEGSVILLFPGVWHRYKPDKKTGWTEHYVGFNGTFTQQLYQHELLSAQNPVIHIGFNERILNEFDELLQLVDEEKPGFQQECAGKLIFLLARMLSIIKNSEFEGKDIERKIQYCCLYFRDHLDKNVNIEELAKELNIGYSYFRRMFKKYTGISPAQYHLGLRIQKSKDLLQFSNKTIKEIAYQLGFESNQYFSRIFHEKCGLSPIKFKQQFRS
jgi:AraC-like DNA-binding protein